MRFKGVIRAVPMALSIAAFAFKAGSVAALAQEAASKRASIQGGAAGDVREFGGDLKIKMNWCPAGEFKMGATAGDTDAYDNEMPQVAVRFTEGFWLGQTEVTQALWKSVMSTTPWQGKERVEIGDLYPAVYISHGGHRENPEADSAQAFCVAFTKREQAAGRIPLDWSYRLPTEAEWEYGCRAGSNSKYSFGNDESQLSKYAWFASNALEAGEKFAHPVATKQPNSWRLFDMHGNVAEWCEDYYDDAKLIGGADPLQNSKTMWRIFRGGAWNNPTFYLRSTFRYWIEPSLRSYAVSFRLALSSERRSPKRAE